MINIEPATSLSAVTLAHQNFVSTDLLNSKHESRAAFLKDLHKIYDASELSPHKFESFNTSEATVWIDPLDGTTDFVKGNLESVTVLIGLSIRGKSRAGIIHNVFSAEDSTKGKTVFATAEHGAFWMQYDPECSREQGLARRL